MKIKATMKKQKWVLVALMSVLTLSLQGQNVVMADQYQSDAEVATIGAVLADYSSPFGNRDQDVSKLTGIDRDLVILENVLADLFRGRRTNNFSIGGSNGTKGIHIPNNGVIFNVAGNGIFRGSNYVSWDDLAVVVTGSNTSKKYTEEELQKLNDEKEAKITELAKEFLSNYGSLLEDLKDNEKIQVSVDYALHVQSTSRKIEGDWAYVTSTKNENKRRMTAQVSMSDVRAFSAGRISENEMSSRITIKGNNDQNKESSDMRILAGIFDDLFNSSFDGMYDRSGNSSWTYFEGFGLMYNVRVHPHRDRYSQARGIGSTKMTQEEFDKKSEEAYPAFEKTIKENLVKYGRTLRSLKGNEMVVLNVSLNSSRNSKLPKTIRLMISKTDIEAYAKGNKSLQQTIDAVNIKKLTSSLDGRSGLFAPTYSQSGSSLSYSYAVPTPSRSSGQGGVPGGRIR